MENDILCKIEKNPVFFFPFPLLGLFFYKPKNGFFNVVIYVQNNIKYKIKKRVLGRNFRFLKRAKFPKDSFLQCFFSLFFFSFRFGYPSPSLEKLRNKNNNKMESQCPLYNSQKYQQIQKNSNSTIFCDYFFSLRKPPGGGKCNRECPSFHFHRSWPLERASKEALFDRISIFYENYHTQKFGFFEFGGEDILTLRMDKNLCQITIHLLNKRLPEKNRYWLSNVAISNGVLSYTCTVCMSEAMNQSLRVNNPEVYFSVNCKPIQEWFSGKSQEDIFNNFPSLRSLLEENVEQIKTKEYHPHQLYKSIQENLKSEKRVSGRSQGEMEERVFRLHCIHLYLRCKMMQVASITNMEETNPGGHELFVKKCALELSEDLKECSSSSSSSSSSSFPISK